MQINNKLSWMMDFCYTDLTESFRFKPVFEENSSPDRTRHSTEVVVQGLTIDYVCLSTMSLLLIDQYIGCDGLVGNLS